MDFDNGAYLDAQERKKTGGGARLRSTQKDFVSAQFDCLDLLSLIASPLCALQWSAHDSLVLSKLPNTFIYPSHLSLLS